MLPAGLGYSKVMGMGSLAKYRKIFMIAGFTIFAFGAIARWHRNRNLGAVEVKSKLVDTPTEAWHNECVTYACRPIGARGPECTALCDRATAEGTPNTQAERITLACKKFCAAENTPTAACASECLVREATRSAGAR